MSKRDCAVHPSLNKYRNGRRHSHRASGWAPTARRLGLELLEDRHMLAPLVGVDFDVPDGDSPLGWRRVSTFGQNETFLNLGDTEIDVTLSAFGADYFGALSPDPQTVPIPGSPPPDFVGVDGILTVTGTQLPPVAPELKAVWSGLKPNQAYEIYVLGAAEIDPQDPQPPDLAFLNTVKIQGAESVTFEQSGKSKRLQINDKEGIVGTSLSSYAKLATPDANNQITVDVYDFVAGGAISVAGLGIREAILINSPAVTDDGDPDNESTSIVEAINIANATPGHDTLVCSQNLSGATIFTGGTPLTITDSLALNCNGLDERVTIDAQQQSRVIDIVPAIEFDAIDVVIDSFNLENGLTVGENLEFAGGILRSTSSGTLYLNDVELRNGRTEGLGADGGCAFVAGDVNITNSGFFGCSVGGDFASGGALSVFGDATLNGTTIEHSSAEGSNGFGGGGNFRRHATLTDTWFKNNSTTGLFGNGGGGAFTGLTATNVLFRDNESSGGSGGGIFNVGPLSVSNGVIENNKAGVHGGGVFSTFGASFDDSALLEASTISRNESMFDGGGIYTSFSDLELVNSTVSGNESLSGLGGGIRTGADLTVNSSTITDNAASGDAPSSGKGGGVWAEYANTSTTLNHAILAGNSASVEGPDFMQGFPGALAADYSLIGDAAGVEFPGVGSIIGDSTNGGAIDPMLGELAQNGGLTETHAPLPGSPVIDAGDPAAVAGENGIPAFDQRGESFMRVFDDFVAAGTGIDIGALEVQPVPSADFDGDGDVDGDDFLTWQRNFLRAEGATRADGDANGDGRVDSLDFEIWQSQFGTMTPNVVPSVAPAIQIHATPTSAASSASAPSQEELIDVALAARLTEQVATLASDTIVMDDDLNLVFDDMALFASFHPLSWSAASSSYRLSDLASRAPNKGDEPEEDRLQYKGVDLALGSLLG